MTVKERNGQPARLLPLTECAADHDPETHRRNQELKQGDYVA
jgi:hypothetical protein